MAARAGLLLATMVAALAATTIATTVTPAHADPVPPLPPASSADAKKQSTLVDAEDIRLRTMYERFGVLTEPTIVETAGSLPTLLLPARAQPYTATDVVAAGGGRREVDGGVLFTAHVLVGPQARLVINGQVGELRLASGASGYATVTAWRGAMEFFGDSPEKKLSIVGWDVQNLRPDTATADGRSYIRTMGGELIVRNVKATNLGFWTGRTGGIAWTGSKGEPSTGGAADSVFSQNVFGAYVSGSEGIQMIGVRLEDNERSGLSVNRDATTTLVSGITSTRNHGDGITIDRASGSRVMRSTVTDNSGDGITVDGRGLGLVATATGVQVHQIKDTLLEGNTVSGNGRYGIRVVGGENSVLRANKVTGSTVGIIIKSGANGTQIEGNTAIAATEAGIQIGPDARRTALVQNTLTDDRRGIVIQGATTNVVSRNTVTGASDFAITVRGQADDTKIQHNKLSGEGWRAIDIRKALGVKTREIHSNNTDGWVSLEANHWYSLIEEHPALLVWGVLVLLPLLGWRSRRKAKKAPRQHPYPEAELLLQRLTGGTMRPPAQLALIAASANGAGASPSRSAGNGAGKKLTAAGTGPSHGSSVFAEAAPRRQPSTRTKPTVPRQDAEPTELIRRGGPAGRVQDHETTAWLTPPRTSGSSDFFSPREAPSAPRPRRGGHDGHQENSQPPTS
ncbi:right-handed parallel beta-helix repeat-containing protein [Frankia nepalensis]|uniref:right-handed parallel beta-helix repeat-containing protein n=1 Tax=Frankia nepalensis TaxID=1836974 RepID=UPI0027DB2586|nr:right-handed parallel beta-helix repeat-containing protein [Frankia nepalensis]